MVTGIIVILTGGRPSGSGRNPGFVGGTGVFGAVTAPDEEGIGVISGVCCWW
ncbi:hypothetical protein GCM10009799_17160 [Nocardiopsis rhodophaea]|uniref:Uncharacterized protein n=1 Tax=Nocardiopsis rhodophaea TaxID=280238 RepID=A0ABN2SST3_9ACTN